VKRRIEKSFLKEIIAIVDLSSTLVSIFVKVKSNLQLFLKIGKVLGIFL
jgi:hypothetical protein